MKQIYHKLQNFIRYRTPGHFYSPIPSVRQLKQNEARLFGKDSTVLEGISLRPEKQKDLFLKLCGYYDEIPFKPHQNGKFRYHFENPNYSYSDGIILYSMLRHFKPQRVIEIGSGFSSCLVLDTNREFFNSEIKCTFIEPFPKLLNSLLSTTERKEATIINSPVQDVDLAIFKQLEAGDILFIDSTHVAKAGSDVNHLIFNVLPSLNDGVLIHFHDIFFPFEYPKQWLYEGRAWNEAYLLHAFLQYNQAFQIEFFSNYFIQEFAELVKEKMPLCLNNSGASLWLSRPQSS